jgi:hypothetical protein
MALHALLVAYLPNIADPARQTFNDAMWKAGWRPYSIPFAWTKQLPSDDRAQVERSIVDQLHAFLASAGDPTCSVLLQLGTEPAFVDPPGWDRIS